MQNQFCVIVANYSIKPTAEFCKSSGAMVLCQQLKPFGEVFTWAKRAYCNSLKLSGFTQCRSRFVVQKFLDYNSVLTNRTWLLQCNQNVYFVCFNCFHSSNRINGRYGHRLVKLWEQKEYTTKPLQVYRTGGRLPVENWKGNPSQYY